MKNKLAILTFLLASSFCVLGQGTFLRYFEGDQTTVAPHTSFRKIEQLTNGNLVCIGIEQDNVTPLSVKIVYTVYSNSGQLLQSWYDTTLHNPNVLALNATYDGGFVAGYQCNSGLNTSYYSIKKYDSNGTEVWDKQINTTISEIFSFSCITQSQDTGFIVGGILVDTSSTPNRFSRYVTKLNSLGNNIWVHRSQTTTNLLLSNMESTNDGGCIFVCDTSIVQGVYYLNAIKLNSLGNVEWSKVYNREILGTESSTILPNGGFALASTVNNTSYVMLCDDQGDSITEKTFNSWDTFNDIDNTYDNGLVITGASGTNNFNENILLLKLDAQLNEQWRREIPRNVITYGANIVVTADSGYAICGFEEPRAFIAKTDSLGNITHTLVEGQITADLNKNCRVDSTDVAITRQMVQVSALNNYFGYTDNSGSFSIEVYDTGQAQVIWHANSLWDKHSCQSDSIPLTLSSSGYHTIDMLGQASIACPDLYISINTPFLRRCFGSMFTVEYCNNGTLPANAAYVDIEIDPFLTVDSSSIPWTLPQTSNIYRFQLGSVNIGQCGSFTFSVTVDCDSTTLGQTHCISAHIYPDSFCISPQPTWDMSSVKVSGKCDIGDTLDFKIENVGTADMTSPSFFLIAEDNVMYSSGSFQLGLGADTTFRFKGNGSTFTLLAQQVEGHPGRSYPKVSVEGCGTNSNGTYSIGFVNQFPHDDRDEFIDVLCLQNVSSYDPNDKRAEPKGIDNEGFIEATQPLNYTIRFQNTGTDTALTVVIRDTITDKLDISTLRLSASSHSYTFQILDSNILVWTFSNIMLPDSNVNEPASHGFVSFNIDQANDNLPGTDLTNRAGIYFDFNSVVLTNTTLNTIIEDYKTWFTFIPSLENTLQLGLYPNPNNGRFALDINTSANGEYRFLIYDLLGRKQYNQKLTGKEPFIIDTELKNGIYLYQLLENGKVVSTGKAIVKN